MAKTKQIFFTPSKFVKICLDAESQKMEDSMSGTINGLLENTFTERARAAMVASGDIDE